jgi:hypothetical protein
MKRLAFLLALLLTGQAFAADGIAPNTPFKVPFKVDGTSVVNRATVAQGADGATLTVLYVAGDDFREVAYSLVRIDGPAPKPDPKPDPKPEPQPKPPVELWGFVVEETADRTPQQAIVLGSPEVRKAFPQRFRILDKDLEVDATLQTYQSRAAGKTLPMLFLTGPDGTLYYEGPLPSTVADMLKLVAEKKGGGK